MIEPTWQRDGVQLYLGDCLDILPQLEAGSVDAVVTDPPYGIDFVSHGQRWKSSHPIAGDDSKMIAKQIKIWCKNYNLPCVMFFSPFKSLGRWRNVLVWVKGEHVGIGGDRKTCWKRDVELIGVSGNGPLNGKRDSSVLRFNAIKSGIHFCEKPLPLMIYLLGKLNEETILDPFMGSGTTGIACVRTGRRFIGVEIEPKYFEISVKRIEAEMDRFPLFTEEKPQATQLAFA